MKYRLRAAGRALGLLAASAVLTSVISTVTGQYHHMDSGRYDGEEIAATADVGACRRTGPIAWDALGYWWECQVLVRTVEGRVVLVTVDRSMVTPADVGRPVTFLEICDERHGTCRYGVPEWSGHWLGFTVLRLAHIVVVGVLLVLALLSLKRALSGESRTRDRVAGSEARDRLSEGVDPRRTTSSTRPPWSRDVTDG